MKQSFADIMPPIADELSIRLTTSVADIGGLSAVETIGFEDECIEDFEGEIE